MKYTSKWCNEQLNAKPMEWSYVKGEVRELVEAIQKRDWVEAKEEVHDVAYTFACALHTSTGISLPLNWVGKASVIKFEKRLDIWKEIFADAGLQFNIKYLENGSNYRKMKKVNAALLMAAEEQRRTMRDDSGLVKAMERIRLKHQLRLQTVKSDELLEKIESLKKECNSEAGRMYVIDSVPSNATEKENKQ